jgi:hypothetical protein
MTENWDYATEEEIEQALDAYDPDDPKHPDFASMWLDAIDRERKREKEDGPDA